MEKKGIIKYIIQHLNEKGLRDVGSKLESESNVQLEPQELVIIKKCIHEGKLDDAMDFIKDIIQKEEDAVHRLELFLVLNKIFLRKMFQFAEKHESGKLLENIRIHLEYISNSIYIRPKVGDMEDDDDTGHINLGLSQEHVLLIKSEIEKIKKCSQLLFLNNSMTMIPSKSTEAETLKKQMAAISHESASQESLLHFINSFNFTREQYGYQKLDELVQKVVKYQISQCKYHNTANNTFSYFFDHQCKQESIPYKVALSIEQHNEEIINVVYSHSGYYFAAVLKGNSVAIYKMIPQNLKRQSSGAVMMNCNSSTSSAIAGICYSIVITQISLLSSIHKNQISSLQWSEDDKMILTASKDKLIKLHDPFTGTCISTIDCHDSMVTSAVFVENDSKILSSGLDYKVNLSTLKGANEFSVSVPGVTVNELLYSAALNMVIIISATTNSLIFYDLKTRTEIDKLPMNDAIISCAISKLDNGCFLLVNSSKATPVLNLINLKSKIINRKYFGHRQERFTNKCNFGGERENFLLCGSEDAQIYVWIRSHSIPIFVTKVHSASVNSVIWPFINQESGWSRGNDILISCSDDHTIKILTNDNIEKVFLGYGTKNEKLEPKMMNIEENKILDTGTGLTSNTNVASSTPPQGQGTSGNRTAVLNVLSRLGNIFLNPFTDTNLEYGSEGEENNDP